jgi:PIN domain nuclease of toxin-antitoxin system
VTTLLDAYALLAFLRDEPAADEVAEILRGDDVAIVSANLAEVVDQLMRRAQIERSVITEALSPVLDERLVVLPVGGQVAWTAAEVRAQHYRRKDAELSLADCLLIASAADGDAIATSDAPVAETARARGILVVGLPDSAGRRP